jgi:hypothetical protein
MLIQKTSPMTGKINEMEIPVTKEQMEAWEGGALIQQAMPQLTPSQREFMISGATDSDWDLLCPADEEGADSADVPSVR